MTTQLATIDTILLAVYLLATLGLGLYFARRIHTGSDYFLARRQSLLAERWSSLFRWAPALQRT